MFVGNEGTEVLYDSRLSARQRQTEADEEPPGKGGTDKVDIWWWLRNNFAYFSIKTGDSYEYPQHIFSTNYGPWHGIESTFYMQ